MPALVNSSVGSLAGNKGDERTRVCPRCSKYSRNFSRSSLPAMLFLSLSCANCDGEVDTPRMVIHFEVLIHTWLQPGDFRQQLEPRSRFNGLRSKPLETVMR